MAGVLRHGDLSLDPHNRQVQVRGAGVELTRSEFELMWLFMRHPGRVFTRLDLLEHLQEEALGAERTIDVHIRNLRGKIEQERSKPYWLETVYGVGYRLRER